MGIKCVVFTSDKGDVKADLAFFNNYNATTNPGASNDITQGYFRGAVWINRTGQTIWQCITDTAGAAVWLQVGSAGEQNGQFVGTAASTPTGTGGAASLTGGTGGATSGAGGTSSLVGGAAVGSNSNGGDAIVAGGAKTGSGIAGTVILRSDTGYLYKSPAPASITSSATLTAAQLLTGLLLSTPGGAANANYQLPLATDLDLALPTSVAGDTFDFSLTNISTNASETATITTNTGWTVAGGGSLVVQPNSAATTRSTAIFRARKTGAGAWNLYLAG